MGLLTLPATGSVYLDSTAFIYSVERIEPYCTLLDTMWRRAQVGQFTVVSSNIAVLETLVKPLREGDRVTENLFRSLFDSNEVFLIPTTRSLWEEAARVHAVTGLKTPDALHAAAAMHAESALFITNDNDFRRVQSLPVSILDDAIGV